MDNDRLDQLVDAVRSSSKYQTISPDLIQKIGRDELSKRKNLKQAVKATKNILHQVAGAFLNSRPDYDNWLEKIRQANGNPEKTKAIASQIMAHHVSTYERIDLLDEIEETIFADLPEIHSVMDIACGLNPLAAPWMRLAPEAHYFAYDIYQNMMDFLQNVLTTWGFRGEGIVCDVTGNLPAQKVDLALALKSIPCLQNLDKSIGTRMIENVNCRYFLISFPSQSLSGVRKGMDEHYETVFSKIMTNHPDWKIQTYQFSTEQFFLIDKNVIQKK